ncbi:hypothetical protein, partial [Klebsiella quasipneumoniae]|uniref:hypothetical protein n=1 Tax=Klebsiella quasipneumoniae TaxID=1463165 RepID=UPI001F4DF96B
KACVLPENPASYRVVRTKSYLFNKATQSLKIWGEYGVHPIVRKVFNVRWPVFCQTMIAQKNVKIW